jgi:hypothetical protein
LVSPDFIASDFIHHHELGALLKKAEQSGAKVLWVPVRHSAYKQTALKNYQAVLNPAKPLADQSKYVVVTFSKGKDRDQPRIAGTAF